MRRWPQVGADASGRPGAGEARDVPGARPTRGAHPGCCGGGGGLLGVGGRDVGKPPRPGPALHTKPWDRLRGRPTLRGEGRGGGSAPPALVAPHPPPRVSQSTELCCGGAGEPERSSRLPEAA